MSLSLVGYTRFVAKRSAVYARPGPDIEGAITQAFAALEGVCKKMTGFDDNSFGDVIKSNQSLFPFA
ncbi:MAG: hypothetical protein EOP04_00085 [Proteobacteria bacterium]|nr:MAG: hypothetical protein EOP04_00085 [Pseudomonadota bacterium]